MFENDAQALRKVIAGLETEHRLLDARIEALVADAVADQLEIKRMKKRKLVIKDNLARLRSTLIPDLDA